jgi:predicted lipoprotein with Yx(FWY)xxD motif
MVAKHVTGLMGTFGTTTRPDGRTQVTLDGRPLYTYNADTPTKILCNGVDGWFVVKA